MNEYFEYKRALLFKGEHHNEKLLTKERALDILKHSNALLLRNTYNFDNTENRNFWYVIKDSFGGFEELKSRTRNKIRHALRFFDIRILTGKEITEYTYAVYRKAFESYKDKSEHALNKEEFLAAIDLKNEYWGCIDKSNGKLVAYSENIIRKESCEFRTLKADLEYLSKGYYPFYGLIYKMSEYYIHDRKFKYVSDGSRTITNRSNIQDFLIKTFNFRKAYTDINIYYKTFLRIAINVFYHFRHLIPQSKLKSLLRQESMARKSKGK